MSEPSDDASIALLSNLQKLGAPLDSPDDIRRLYKGRLAEVLDFLASNVVGRRDALSSRTGIQAYRESSRPSSHGVDADVDPLHARVKRAEARVKLAQREVDNSEETLRKQTDSLDQSEREVERLQHTLADRHSTALLLSVLERKEAIRNERFKEILNLLSALKDKARTQAAVRYHSQVRPPQAAISPATKPIRVPRTENTRDTLAALQSHAVRIAHLTLLAKDNTLPARTKEAEARLLNAVARSMGLNSDDAKVVAAYERYRAAGEARGRVNIEYRSPLPAANPGDDIEDLTERIMCKERELQDLADRAAALTLACARALQADAVFSRETAPQLQEELQREATTAQGHVDTLRLSIVHRQRPEAELTLREASARDLHKGRSFEQTLLDIERDYADARATETFLEEADKLLSPDTAAVETHAAMAASYAGEEAVLSARLQKLFSRKGAKADAGQALVQDIERLVAEVGIIAGSSHMYASTNG
ncbi:hypothetical protein C8Q77DRAFT_1264059 [Trametes polyzona]|nr:hypothetical protein C8Q77DRAFT_1264059 [Trametes polyzona]